MTADTKWPRARDAASVFSAPYAPPDEAIAAGLLDAAPVRGRGRTRASTRYATRLIEGIRAKAGGLGGIEDFLHAYSLSTKEGLALMVLAEALLRVPDAATADRLIEDKLATGDWSSHEVRSNALLGVGLGLDARHHRPHHPARRDAGHHPGERSSSASACRRCARPRARRCGSSARISCSGRPSRRRSSARRRAPRVALFLRHAGRGRPHRGRRRALFRLLCACHRRDRRERRQRGAAERGPASRSSSRRCIRASRRSRATRVLAELVPQRARARPQGARPRSQFHHRRRGGRPARALARRDRGGAGRSVAARLGRFRARGAGLSEARAGGDRLARRASRARSAAA